MSEASPFIEDGFSSGFKIMPGLQIGVQFRSNQFFRYDGPVYSLEKYIKALPADISEHLQGFSYRKVGGFNFKLGSATDEGYIMAVLNISPRANIFNEAHEASEVLVQASMIEELQAYVELNRYSINLHSLSPHQIGNVCGFIAAVSSGYTKAEMIKLIKQNNDYDTLNLFNRLDII